MRRACLIDLGLGPRKAVKMLADLGLGLHQIDDVLITHLDADHFQMGWAKWLPMHVRVRLHVRHARRLPDLDKLGERVEAFDGDGEVRLASGIAARPLTLAHDDDGVTAFRLDMPEEFGGGRLGFATDLGRVTRALIDLFHDNGNGVDVLAIESNYCPEMQRSSSRPEFLKRRIMGGRGHLSNHEAVEAVRKIQPREHVVLLHLSRECNDGALVSRLHEGADYTLTIAEQDRPTRRVRVGTAGRVRPVVVRCVQPSLFGAIGT
jgi:ribonuclease BN (tRNA processing enzyme)